MPPSSLPVLALPHPHILFPGARLTFPLSRSHAEHLLSLSQSDPTVQPVVAAVPIPSPAAASEWGTAARVVRLIRPPARNPRQPFLVSLLGLTRVHLALPFIPATDSDSALPDHPIEYPDPAAHPPPPRESVALFKSAALRLLDRLATDSTQLARKDAWLKASAMVEDVAPDKAPWMADVLVNAVGAEYTDKLALLSTPSPADRLALATTLFSKHAAISEVSHKIAASVDESLSKQQKEFFLRQQLTAIQRELNALSRSPLPSSPSSTSGDSDLDDDDQHDLSDLADLKAKIEALPPGSEVRRMGVKEWRRLKRIPAGSVENGVVRTYLEWLTSIPWGPPPPSDSSDGGDALLTDRGFLDRARSQLDADHFGLDKIKRRLIEYLAVLRLKEMNALAEKKDAPAISTPAPASPKTKGPILLFVGPPGTGKTSLGLSIARALHRPFQRLSLGGVRDEAEIRGHRRTYVASGPGMIVQALRKAGRLDAVVLLDEVDKVGVGNWHGDPGAALLEVLDPEQNWGFNDHYINVPIDLSQVLFICTANTLDTISAPLLDRCEVIQLSGYTYDEKTHIARKFLLPKQLLANGLTGAHLTLTPDALRHIATLYTREAGVRSLERAIGAVVRYKAVQWAERVDGGGEGKAEAEWVSVVEEGELEKILGVARWDGEEREREVRRGLTYGLVVSGMGEGGILPVETMIVPGGGKLKLTGSLGEVIKESGEIALTWVKTHAYDLRITNTRTEDALKVPDPIDIHLHLPAGAQKKDGPSAGIAMVCAFVSLLTGACVGRDIAMTGEITLRGRVTPVGGIKEKVLGAHRAQIKKVILPWANRKDVEHDVALEIRDEIQFVFVRTVREALEAAFGKGGLGWRPTTMLVESRL